ncbi:hypothetical protein TSA6c_17215 [Azospirillum sp. TSA6c]|uniref:hypothetical protein n=1 Tax=Azospirillum sp. TSA6c TaxID=709813 RepID=UPI000D6148DB|nr:hypothetical protein [Azospirillum sp. TSA6c]PWC48166.1 hypothetical protein TSA6c_17215 [Azospirillum sp. TSA6c]
MHLRLIKLSYLQCICEQALEKARQTALRIATGICEEPAPALIIRDQQLARLFGGVGPEDAAADAIQSPPPGPLCGSDALLLPV